MKQVYNELAESFKTIEETHEVLCLLLDDDTYVTEEGYLDEHGDILSQMQLKVSKTVKEKIQMEKASNLEAEKKKQFDSRLATFTASVQNFGKSSPNLSNLSTAKTISFADMRLEL